MTTSCILELVQENRLGDEENTHMQRIYHLPHHLLSTLVALRCMLTNIPQWGSVIGFPFHVISHGSKFIAYVLFSKNGFPSWAQILNQGFPEPIFPLTGTAYRTSGCFPSHQASPSRLHFTLWLFKWPLVLGTGIPFSVPLTCINGKQFSQGEEVTFDMVLFLSQALLFLAS